MSLIITDSYSNRSPGQVLYITETGRGATVAAYSALDQIGMAASRMGRLRRMAKAIDDARYTFDDKIVDSMRAEARKTARRAVWSYFVGIIHLRAGFIC